MKVEPAPGMLATDTAPPIRIASSRTMARPRPDPPNRRVMLVSAWTNLSNRPACRSGAMPMPVSETVSRRR